MFLLRNLIFSSDSLAIIVMYWKNKCRSHCARWACTFPLSFKFWRNRSSNRLNIDSSWWEYLGASFTALSFVAEVTGFWFALLQMTFTPRHLKHHRNQFTEGNIYVIRCWTANVTLRRLWELCDVILQPEANLILLNTFYWRKNSNRLYQIYQELQVLYLRIH